MTAHYILYNPQTKEVFEEDTHPWMDLVPRYSGYYIVDTAIPPTNHSSRYGYLSGKTPRDAFWKIFDLTPTHLPKEFRMHLLLMGVPT